MDPRRPAGGRARWRRGRSRSRPRRPRAEPIRAHGVRHCSRRQEPARRRAPLEDRLDFLGGLTLRVERALEDLDGGAVVETGRRSSRRDPTPHRARGATHEVLRSGPRHGPVVSGLRSGLGGPRGVSVRPPVRRAAGRSDALRRRGPRRAGPLRARNADVVVRVAAPYPRAGARVAVHRAGPPGVRTLRPTAGIRLHARGPRGARRGFTERLGLERFTLVVHDYVVPSVFRSSSIGPRASGASCC